MIKRKIIGLTVCAALAITDSILPQTAMAAIQTPWAVNARAVEQDTEIIPSSVSWRRKQNTPSAPTPVPTLSVKLPCIKRPAEPPSTPQPTTPPVKPTPQPAKGYALCSCGATLTMEELVPHMKAHALKGESHSYSAW